jgi:hypothetical protein
VPGPLRWQRKHAARARTLTAQDSRANAKEDLRARLQEVEDRATLPARPKTRAECEDVPRPCPHVSCKYNLFLDLSPRGRPTTETKPKILLNFPDLEPDQIPADRSCALDVADRGGETLEVVGEALNLTREAIRIIENKVLAKLSRTIDIDRDASFAHPVDSNLSTQDAEGDSRSGTHKEPFEDRYAFRRKLFSGDTERDERADTDWLWDRLERRRVTRELVEKGVASEFEGMPVTALAARAVAAVEKHWADFGRGPSWEELAELAAVPKMEDRVGLLRRSLSGLSESGRLSHSKSEGVRLHRDGARAPSKVRLPIAR